MAYTLHCPVCKVVTGHIGDEHTGDVPMVVQVNEQWQSAKPDTPGAIVGEFCAAHHPDPAIRVEDKPTVRMTVRVVDDAGHPQKSQG